MTLIEISSWIANNISLITYFFAAALMYVSWLAGNKNGKKCGEIRGRMLGFEEGRGFPKAVQSVEEGKSYEIKEFFSRPYAELHGDKPVYAVVFNSGFPPILIEFTTKREIPKDAKYLNRDKDGWHFSSVPLPELSQRAEHIGSIEQGAETRQCV